jgi:hypothetical protein
VPIWHHLLKLKSAETDKYQTGQAGISMGETQRTLANLQAESLIVVVRGQKVRSPSPNMG